MFLNSEGKISVWFAPVVAITLEATTLNESSLS